MCKGSMLNHKYSISQLDENSLSKVMHSLFTKEPLEIT